MTRTSFDTGCCSSFALPKGRHPVPYQRRAREELTTVNRRTCVSHRLPSEPVCTDAQFSRLLARPNAQLLRR